MRNRTKSLLFSLTLALIFIYPFLVSANVSSALTYLKEQAQDAWITQALVVGGETNIETSHLSSINEGMNPTNDYAKAMLALVALQENPTTFGSEDYVAKLKTYFNNNQMGDSGLLNDDIWSILALASVYQANSPEAIASKNFILDNQNDDGGWSYSTSGGSDTNDTASAIMALIEAGISSSDEAIVKALAFLQSAQNDDGGFPYDPNSPYGTDSDSGSDAWVIMAIKKVGQNPLDWDKNGSNPLSHLESLQDDDGGFWWVLPGSSEWNNKAMTSYSVIALSNKTFPVKYYNIPEPVVEYSVRLVVKGSAGILCDANIESDTAMNTIVNAVSECNLNYNILDTEYGPYLNQINDDISEGAMGWLYYVNKESPMVGASLYELSEGDEVLWYFGEWGWDNATLEEGNEEFSVSVLQPVFINVPITINNATININSLINDDGSNAKAILSRISMSAETSISSTSVEVIIPDGAEVSGPSGWNGIINVPRVEANNSITVNPDSGFSAEVFSVIEVGYGDEELLFSKAVRLLIPDSAGKDVGYSRSGNFTKITTVCSADTQDAGDSLDAGSECKIDVNDDLVIWTKHFTKFATYAQTVVQVSSGGSSVLITSYCQEVEYDEWQTDCVDGFQYRDILIKNPLVCSLTDEQEGSRKRQCGSLSALNDSEDVESVEGTKDIEGGLRNIVDGDEDISVLPNTDTEEGRVNVLGVIEIINIGSEISGSIVTGEANVVATGNVDLLLTELTLKRDIDLEISNNKSIVKEIVSDLNVDNNTRYAISNFITYGSLTALKLGSGERAGIVNSYFNTFGRMPSSSKDWDDIIKIANGEKPRLINNDSEENAKNIFKEIFLREASFGDELKINMISYGLRPLKRDLEKEKEGIKIFQEHFNSNPISSLDWDIVRAISY